MVNGCDSARSCRVWLCQWRMMFCSDEIEVGDQRQSIVSIFHRGEFWGQEFKFFPSAELNLSLTSLPHSSWRREGCPPSTPINHQKPNHSVFGFPIVSPLHNHPECCLPTRPACYCVHPWAHPHKAGLPWPVIARQQGALWQFWLGHNMHANMSLMLRLQSGGTANLQLHPCSWCAPKDPNGSLQQQNDGSIESLLSLSRCCRLSQRTFCWPKKVQRSWSPAEFLTS